MELRGKAAPRRGRVTTTTQGQVCAQTALDKTLMTLDPLTCWAGELTGDSFCLFY